MGVPSTTCVVRTPLPPPPPGELALSLALAPPAEGEGPSSGRRTSEVGFGGGGSLKVLVGGERSMDWVMVMRAGGGEEVDGEAGGGW